MLNSNPLVSVIVPVYNVEHYIHRAVDSLLNQTYPYLDIILVDDGSPDACPRICDEYACKDSRARVIHKTNGGLSDARNAGLEIAKGEYLTFLDSDDYLSTDAIERFLRTAQEQDADIVCCGLNIIDADGKIYDYRKGDVSRSASGQDVVMRLFKDVFPYNFTHSKFYRRALFFGVRFPVGRIYEDMATTYIVVNKAHRVFCMKECLYYYERGRSGNISSELHSKKAAWSYYCGCLNCVERISFSKEYSEYKEALPIIIKNLYVWIKLCMETSICLGKDEYDAYCQKIRLLLSEISMPMPWKIKLLSKFSSIYYYSYPFIKRIK